MTRLMTQFEYPGVPVNTSRHATLAVPVAHLRYMTDPLSKPGDRTPMWTLEELCAYLRTTPATVHAWRKHGQGPRADKVGRHLLFADADVRAWLKSRVAGTDGDDDGAAPEHRTTGSGW
ncbi:helix-turn-helix domain-containing protein [Promicromonospora sp. NPDC050262]|uniref:helix-turn-helix transcriptional regulator n=1 Tax=Promicromonospora sp. NPDC050262 TaxID=3155036 RepID=UPI0033FFAC8D